MIVASIDIGSNTVLLLIARIFDNNNFIETVKNYYRAPRISKGLILGSRISEDKIFELMNVLSEYKIITENYGCEKIFLIATNALRIASNAKEISNMIKKKFNWDLKIIDGHEEARLSFLGATYNFTNHEKVVIDIGGGSTEIVYGSEEKIIYKNSFPVGVVSFTEKYFKNHLPNFDEIENIKKDLRKIFNELTNFIPCRTFTIAVAGTPTTLSCIKQNIKVYDENLVDNSLITFEDINEIALKLSNMTAEQIRNQFGQVVEGREDVLFTGTLILMSFMEILELNKITVSNKGLRYGIIIDYIKEIKQSNKEK
ncbi:MAG: hypothetical protein QHH13_13835 [Melioribacter sp.]|uniref:Ppx/GppA phosphatase family protein n=1 Tax=Rosettibacter primus TaxID=3111523 RepID=UPI00247DC57C|nr:hypothetical protein [Melioribacter sp.]